MRLRAAFLFGAMALALVPGFGDILIELAHAHDGDEAPEHLCDGHCHDCTLQVQAPTLTPSVSQTETPRSVVELADAPQRAAGARPGYATVLERPPMA